MLLIVNDSSVLIDLHKAGLLALFLELNAELVVSDLIIADELLSFTDSDKKRMREAMQVKSLSPAQMQEVGNTQRQFPALTIHDCASFIIARSLASCVLVTGDKRLRGVSEARGVKCKGVIWVIDELAAQFPSKKRELTSGVHVWQNDPTVRLPKEELKNLLGRLTS